MAQSNQPADVRIVATALKGPVAEIFRTLLPPLARLSAEEVYTLAMANSDLLQGCLLIFRKRRDAFAHLLVDAQGRKVSDEFVHLKCGFTLHEIITMITRTHAKRHFQAALGGDPNDPRSPAGRMYAALKEYLIHEWQVPLVPHYAPLPVDKVLTMGPSILDVREAATLDAISGALPGQVAAGRAVAAHQASKSLPPRAAQPAPAVAAPPPAPEPPAPEPSAPEVAATSPPPPAPAPRPMPRRPVAPPKFEGTPQEEFWYQTLDDRQVRSALDLRDDDEIRLLVGILAQLGEPAHSGFLAPLRLSMPQAAVALTMAYRTMGETAFKSVFGSPGDDREITGLTRRLEAQDVGSRTDLRTLMRAMESSLRIKQLNRARA